MKPDLTEPRRAIEEAIDILNQRPRDYGGHLEREGTSTIDGTAMSAAMSWDEYVMHDDGRVGRLCRGVTDNGGLIVLFRGEREKRVVPASKLSYI